MKGKQVCNGGLIGSLPRREGDGDGQAARIDHRIDLSAQSPTRATDGVIFAPFLPEAACW